MGQAQVRIGEVLRRIADAQVGEAGIDLVERRSLGVWVRSHRIAGRRGFSHTAFGGGRHATLLFIRVGIRRETIAGRHIGRAVL